ncbi:MAG: inositol monophosphatase family protein [Candidatus Hermodarchaeota archaeon]
MSKYNKELKLAIHLVKKATKITEWFRNKGFKSYSKDDDSPVTLADFTSQIFIIAMIKNHFPNDEIIAEEEDVRFIDKNSLNFVRQCLLELDISNIKNIKNYIKYRGNPSQRQWTVDPIDGTIGFQKGLSYAVGVGFMENSIPRVSAIAVPNYAGKPLAIFSAEQGQGAYVSYKNNENIQIKVNNKNNLKDIRLCHSLHYDQPWVLQFARSIGITNFVQIDSMAKFAMIADGSADLYIKPLDPEHSFSWDFLPGDLIVREAGGIVSDLDGIPLEFRNEKCIWTKPGIVSSNNLLHRKILNKIKENLSDFFK